MRGVMMKLSNKLFSIIKYLFIIVLYLDLMLFAGVDAIKKPLFDIIMSQKGESVLFFLETQENNPNWGNKADAVYISESDEFINIGVAKAQKSNYFVSSMWGNRFIYLPKDSCYQINKVTGGINVVENDFIANGGLFIARVGIIKTEPIYYVGYTQNESQITDKSLIYKEKFYFSNGLCGWVFVIDALIEQNDNDRMYILI